jgi:hypothetical protein
VGLAIIHKRPYLSFICKRALHLFKHNNNNKSFFFVFRVARAKFVVVVGGFFSKKNSYHTF